MPRFSAASAIAAAAAAVSCVSAGVIPLLDSRAPHFAEIIQPTPNYFLLLNSSEVNATFLFTYRNGERSDETTATVSLQNATGVYPIAADLAFVDNWYTVNTTVSVPSATIADGNYTLLVQELYQGQVVSDIQQGFALSHDPSANVTAPDQGYGATASSLAGPSASASAYWGVNPAASQAAPVAAAAAASQTASPSSASVVEGKAASLGDALRNLLGGFVARRH